MRALFVPRKILYVANRGRLTPCPSLCLIFGIRRVRALYVAVCYHEKGGGVTAKGWKSKQQLFQCKSMSTLNLPQVTHPLCPLRVPL